MDEALYFNTVKSKEVFSSNISKESIAFLKKRNVPPEYSKAVLGGFCGYLLSNRFSIHNTELQIDYFLGASEEEVYDIVGYNKWYCQNDDFTAIGVLCGGDPIGFKSNSIDKAVYIWFNTGSNISEDRIERVANSFQEFHEFIERIVYHILFDYIRLLDNKMVIKVIDAKDMIIYEGTVEKAFEDYDLCKHKAEPVVTEKTKNVYRLV